VNCPPFPISLSFWVELVGACNSIGNLHDRWSVLPRRAGGGRQTMDRVPSTDHGFDSRLAHTTHAAAAPRDAVGHPHTRRLQLQGGGICPPRRRRCLPGRSPTAASRSMASPHTPRPAAPPPVGTTATDAGAGYHNLFLLISRQPQVWSPP
jgi:hypothetical protein